MTRGLAMLAVPSALVGVAAFVVAAAVGFPEGHDTDWSIAISEQGAPNAYSQFAEYASGRPHGEQHLAAHQFGRALYEAIGLEGVEVCDGRFSYGCLHQVLGMALGVYGTDAIGMLQDRCAQEVGTPQQSSGTSVCSHALGHGLMFNFGYEATGLRRAIDTCALHTNSTLRWCEFGAFMEFNVHFMQGGPLDVRVPDERGEWYPCDEYTGDVREVCYYAQPRWWRFRALKEGEHDEVALARAAGQLCAELSGDIRVLCFRGIGSAIAWNGAGPLEGKGRWCDAVASGADDRRACTSDLAYSLTMIEKKKPGDDDSLIRVICSGLGDEERRCEEDAHTFLEEARGE